MQDSKRHVHWVMCSTPRGITGKIAEDYKRDYYEKYVLNASRHHRKNRSRAAVARTVPLQCSTPRGITGKIAVADHALRGGLTLCSTPRGITGKIAQER